MTKKQQLRKKIEKELMPERKKIRRARKPMTEEQKKAAAERLAKARAAKKKTSGAPKNVHPSVAALPDDDMFSLKSVRDWIKHNKELLSEERRALRANVKGSQSKVTSIEGYVRNMEHYIRTGDWVDSFYGKEQGQKMKRKCVAMAYHFEGPFKGMAKREVGVTYSDVGFWTAEMHADYYNLNSTSEPSRRRNVRKRNTVSKAKSSRKRK